MSEAVPILTNEILEDRYRLGGLLGGGNFGKVYLAEELQSGRAFRELALKLYSPEATKSGNIEGMFEDCELPSRILASTAATDIKRHFVNIFGCGRLKTSIGECAYVAMELVQGAVNLEDITQRHINAEHHPQEQEVAGYMEQFFTALAQAHTAGVYHRDIKGANVMVTGGVVKVVDFGMGARISEGETPLKTTMSIYAPENFENTYSAASDIYQAGLMFYKLWTGYHPYEKQSAQKPGEGDADYNRRALDEARRLRMAWEYEPGWVHGCEKSEKLDAILSKCLRYSERERYQSAAHILRELKQTGIDTAREALANKDYVFAMEAAQKALEAVGLGAADKTELLWLLGDIHGAQGKNSEAKASYVEAQKLAEQAGVYFLNKPKMRELLTVLADCCEALGQKGLANQYRRKINSYI